MHKRNRHSRLFVRNPGPHNTVLNWHHVPPKEFYFYARAFHKAAKSLVESVELDANPFADFNACPVVFMYRHALELHLKAIVIGIRARTHLGSKAEVRVEPARLDSTRSWHRLVAEEMKVAKLNR